MAQVYKAPTVLCPHCGNPVTRFSGSRCPHCRKDMRTPSNDPFTQNRKVARPAPRRKPPAPLSHGKVIPHSSAITILFFSGILGTLFFFATVIDAKYFRRREDVQWFPAQVAITNVALDYVMTEKAREGRRLRVSFRNTSDKPIHLLTADILIFGERGREEVQKESFYGEILFDSIDRGGTPVGPGEEYVPPKGIGRLFFPSFIPELDWRGEQASRAQVMPRQMSHESFRH